MLLAEVLSEYPDELTADFQETYNLNIDDMGVAYSVGHAAILCAQLPRNSRVFRAINPNLEWSHLEQLIAWCEYDIRVLTQAMCGGDPKSIRPLLPDAFLPEGMHADKKSSMSIDDFDKFMQRERNEVTNG